MTLASVIVVAAIAPQLPTAQAQETSSVTSHPWIGQTAPEFALEKVGGGQLALGDLKGRYVVIHFGTSW